METYVINTKAFGEMTEEQFYQFCQSNKPLHFEKNSNGQIVIMPPTGSETGLRNANITGQLWAWNEKSNLGIVFDSNAGFTLPNKAVRAADASWISKERWQQVPAADKERFAHICPDFIIELMSKNDDLEELKKKMEEWMENGCRLAWLIDVKNEKVYIYRKDGSQHMISSFDEIVSGEEVLPGFELDLKKLKVV